MLWHVAYVDMFYCKKILNIIVGPLCPDFYKVPSSDKHSLLWLANWHNALLLAEHHKQELEI